MEEIIMKNNSLDSKVNRLIEIAKEKIECGLRNTEYSNMFKKILIDYIDFLKVGIELGLINNENINLYEINECVYRPDGNAYAAWRCHSLFIDPRFFIEINEDEQKNVIFHELIHSLLDQLLSSKQCVNFGNFLNKVNDILDKERISEILNNYQGLVSDNFLDSKLKNIFNLVSLEISRFLNEATTQNLAEILTSKSLKKSRDDYQKFESKIFTTEILLTSNFCTYPEYQQVFNAFLRTINGLGNIDNDEELFSRYFEMLKSGVIWQQIIGTYSEKNKLSELFEFLMTMSILLTAKESSMGIGVEYEGDKNKPTQLINSLYNKMIELRNEDEIINYPYIEYEKPEAKKIKITCSLKR